jgi:hypothetical protein
MNTKTDISTPLVRAIASAWGAIQRANPDVPDVMITVGAGAMLGGLKLGHFAPHRWARGESTIHELFVGGEGLERGAAAVMATLIHEAAHGVAVATDRQDVSRNGRYHNGTFRDIAESMGITVTHSKTLGWSTTELSETGATKYAAAIKRLDTAIVAYRRDPSVMVIPTGRPGSPIGIGGATKGRGRPSNNNGLSLTCGCDTPRRIRISPSIAELGGITCDVCRCRFE